MKRLGIFFDNKIGPRFWRKCRMQTFSCAFWKVIFVRATISCRSIAARKVERLSQISNRTILARHSKRRGGGSRRSSAQRLNRNGRKRGVSRKRVALGANLKKHPGISAIKIARVMATSKRSKNGSLPEPVRSAFASGLYSAIEVQNRIRELIKLAKEQGYLTFD